MRAFALILFVSAVAESCSGGPSGPKPNPNGTPAGTFTVTVSATENSGKAQSAKLTLIVN